MRTLTALLAVALIATPPMALADDEAAPTAVTSPAVTPSAGTPTAGTPTVPADGVAEPIAPAPAGEASAEEEGDTADPTAVVPSAPSTADAEAVDPPSTTASDEGEAAATAPAPSGAPAVTTEAASEATPSAVGEAASGTTPATADEAAATTPSAVDGPTAAPAVALEETPLQDEDDGAAGTAAASPAAPAAGETPAATPAEAVPTAPSPAAAAAAAALGLGLTPTTSAAATTSLSYRIGVLDDAPPFSSAGRFGVRAGFDVDVARALCSIMDATCQLVPLAADDVLSALRERRIDAAVAALARNQQLTDEVDFTDPYVRLSMRYVVPKAAVNDLEAEDRAVYAAVSGTPQADYLISTFRPPNTVWLYPNSEGMWVDLALHRLDAVLAPALTAQREFLSTPLGEPFRFATSAQRTMELSRGAAIAVRKGDDQLRERLNRAIQSLLRSPSYGEILTRHLDTEFASTPLSEQPETASGG
ncbi:transporter substrate-binding domain-containing protein [Acuticoccus mangrovi]|uniref:Transporter substrate-binding domain-containing protein n=1 Tax=Acuticoccus mangrovi TaxID=2796142 RepID=A0A934MIQ4_9HYPH|nr:transporter substrate-binding domain-containing protein [Acuticoccus mangrovi]MBJ3777431.1 transporter substrate-binding domain-containing protein [Acuticoccus mangrovi]